MGTLLLTRAGFPHWRVEQLYLLKYIGFGVGAVLPAVLLSHAQQWGDGRAVNLILLSLCAVLGYL